MKRYGFTFTSFFVFVMLFSAVPSAMAQCPATMHQHEDGNCYAGNPEQGCWQCRPETRPGYEAAAAKTMTGVLTSLGSPDGRPVFYPDQIKVYPFLGSPYAGGYWNYRQTSDLSAEQVWSAFVKAFQNNGHVRSGQRWQGSGYSNAGYFLFRPSESLGFTAPKVPGTEAVWLVRIIAKPVGTQEQYGVRGPSFLATAIGIGATVYAGNLASNSSLGAQFGSAYLNQLAYTLFSYHEAVQLVRQRLDITIEVENCATHDTQVFSGQSGLTLIQKDRLVENAYRSATELNRYSLDNAVQQAMSGALTGFKVRPPMVVLNQTKTQQASSYVRNLTKELRTEVAETEELTKLTEEFTTLQVQLDAAKTKLREAGKKAKAEQEK